MVLRLYRGRSVPGNPRLARVGLLLRLNLA